MGMNHDTCGVWDNWWFQNYDALNFMQFILEHLAHTCEVWTSMARRPLSATLRCVLSSVFPIAPENNMARSPHQTTN